LLQSLVALEVTFARVDMSSELWHRHPYGWEPGHQALAAYFEALAAIDTDLEADILAGRHWNAYLQAMRTEPEVLVTDDTKLSFRLLRMSYLWAKRRTEFGANVEEYATFPDE